MTNEKTNVTAAAAGRPNGGLRWAWLLALPIAGALSVSAAALAGPGGFGGGHRGGGPGMGMGMGMEGRHGQHLLEAANATDAQKAQIKAAWDTARPQLKALHEEGAKLREELQKTLTLATIDRAKVETLRKQQVQLMDKASSITTQAFVTSAQVLTPEQRQKVATAMQEKRGRRHDKAE